MQPAGDSASPLSGTLPPLLSRRQRDPLPFSGAQGEDIHDWIRHYERVSSYNRWDDPTKLANVVFFLESTAHTWVENHEAELPTWAIFSQKMLSFFGGGEERTRMARHQLSTRAQISGETFTSYIEDVSWLCHRDNRSMEEAEKVANLLKGIAEDAFRHLVSKDQLSVATFTEECRKLEEAQRARLAVYHLLPNITQSAFMLPETRTMDANFWTQIREIIPEEVRLVQPHCATGLAGSRGYQMPSVTVPTDIIRNEVRSYLRPPATTPAEVTSAPIRETTRLASTPVVASYSDRSQPPSVVYRHPSPPRSPQPIRTDIWRTPSRRPVCFRCGIPGHVYRYCHRRLQDLNLSRYNSRFTRDDVDDSRFDEYGYSSRIIPSRRRMSRSPSLSARRHPTPPLRTCVSNVDRQEN